ncbi:MAG: ABC transporter ATP-binding protein [Candidatus Thorarchaeota archaeon]
MKTITSAASFIEIQDVIKLYETEKKDVKIAALRGIELAVDQGELITIIGPSGSGKTTLIKLLGGIEKPSSGSIKIGDKLVNSLTGRKLIDFRRRNVGFVWQFPEKNLLPGLSVLKNIMLPMQIAHIGTHQERYKRALDLLDIIGLSTRKESLPRQLSGGEAQRVALLAALANQPELVLADEPTGELDSANTSRIIEYLKDLNQEIGQTFIVVTHDKRFAAMTKKTYQIHDGLLSWLSRSMDGESSIWNREHLGIIDSRGIIRIPNDLVEKAGLDDYVKIRYNEKRQCIEIFPASKID